jgi:hypothetical protein
LEACRAGSDEEQSQSARNAEVAVCNQDSLEGRLTLELIDGCATASGIGTFTASHGPLGSIPAELAKDMLAAT